MRAKCDLCASVCGVLLAGIVCLGLSPGLCGRTVRSRTTKALPAIRVGVSYAASGPASLLPKELLAGSLAYFDTVNLSGGVNGQQIAVVAKDDRYDPDSAVQNAYHLITDDHVFVLFDFVGTANLARILPLLQFFDDQHIVTVGPYTGSDPPRRPPYEQYAFNIRPSYCEETNALVLYLYAEGKRRFVLFGQADALGKNGETCLDEELSKLKLPLATVVTCSRNDSMDSDMRLQVGILRRAGADAILVAATYPLGSAFIRDVRASGWDVPIAMTYSDALPVLLKMPKRGGLPAASNLIDADVVPLPSDTRYPLVRDYCAHVAESERSSSSLEGWLNAVVLTEGLRRAGPEATRLSFIAAMEGLKGWDPGLGAPLAFTHTDHEGLHQVWVNEVQEGRWVTVAMQSHP